MSTPLRSSTPAPGIEGLASGSVRAADLEAVLGALAHGARRQILLVLRFHGCRMTAGEIADRFAHSWPTTTRHLGVLRGAGLVAVERRGRERHYELREDRLVDVLDGWLRWFDGREPVPDRGNR